MNMDVFWLIVLSASYNLLQAKQPICRRATETSYRTGQGNSSFVYFYYFGYLFSFAILGEVEVL